MKSWTRAIGAGQADTRAVRRPLAWLAVLAIVGQIVLLTSAWLLPLVSEFRLISDTMSELVLGRYGFLQTIAFLVAGLGTLGLAFVINQLTAGAWGSRIGSLLVASYGAGAILVALFPTERVDRPADIWSQSTIGTIHLVVALVSFVSMIIGMFVLTWTFRRAASWRALVPWSALCAGGALALFLVQNESPWVGLLQRLLVSVIAAWMILVASRALAIVRFDEESRLPTSPR